MANVAVCWVANQKVGLTVLGGGYTKKTHHGGRDGPIKKVNIKGI